MNNDIDYGSLLVAVLTVHSSMCVFSWNSENKPKNGGICVANHTSPIDVIILASDGCYAMVNVSESLLNLLCVYDGLIVCTRSA